MVLAFVNAGNNHVCLVIFLCTRVYNHVCVPCVSCVPPCVRVCGCVDLGAHGWVCWVCGYIYVHAGCPLRGLHVLMDQTAQATRAE